MDGLGPAAQRRLMKELRDWNRSDAADHDGLVLRPREDHRLDEWQCWLPGPKGTPYEGGRFHMLILVPYNYPMAAPKVRFLTRVCHPNVNLKTGEICVDVLAARWSPAWTLESICLAIQVLLTEPDESSPLNCDAGNLLRCKDLRGYRSLVRMYTELYAMAPPPTSTTPASVAGSTTDTRPAPAD